MERSTTPDSGGTTPQVLIDEETFRPKQEIIHSCTHAYDIAKSWWHGRKFFNDKMSEIDANYHGKPPFSPSSLEAHGMSYRNNWFTKPLATVIDRGITPFTGLVNSVKYLTTSELPTQLLDASNKSEIFQKKITEMLRGWSGWVDLVEAVPTENAKFGHGCVARIDPMEWRPTYFRTDEFFVDENQVRDAAECKILILRHNFSPTELYNLIACDAEDIDAMTEDEQKELARQARVEAEAAGWNVVNLVKAINDAEPLPNPNLQEARKAEDAEMQDNIRRAHRNGMPVVESGICFYERLGGGINQMIFRWRDGLELYEATDVFERMQDCATFTTFERGNGKVYGSRGLGHALVNLAITLDICRCEFADAIRRRTLVPVQIKPGNKVTVGSTVQTPFFTIETEGEILEATRVLDVPLEEYEALDKQLTGLMEVIGGVYLPGEIADPQASRTATEASITAQRENSIRESKLARYSTQWGEMVTAMQRAICHPDNIKAAKTVHALRVQGFAVFEPDVEEFANDIGEPIDERLLMPDLPDHVDEEAVEAIVDLMEKGLSAVEIYKLGRSSGIDTVGESPAARAQKLQAIQGFCDGNQQIDQNAWLRMKVTTYADSGIADEIIIPPAESAAKFIEATRMQKLEFAILFEPRKVDVSPNDFHMAHRSVIKDRLGELSPLFLKTNVLPTPDLEKGIDFSLQHFAQHLVLGEQQGEPKDIIKQDRAWLDANEQAFQQLQARMAQAPLGGRPASLTPVGAQPTGKQPLSIAAQAAGSPPPEGADPAPPAPPPPGTVAPPPPGTPGVPTAAPGTQSSAQDLAGKDTAPTPDIPGIDSSNAA